MGTICSDCSKLAEQNIFRNQSEAIEKDPEEIPLH